MRSTGRSRAATSPAGSPMPGRYCSTWRRCWPTGGSSRPASGARRSEHDRKGRVTRPMMSGIRVKLLAGFGAVLVLLAVVGVIGWRNTVASSTAFANLYDDELTQLQDLSVVLRSVYELRLGAMAVSY